LVDCLLTPDSPIVTPVTARFFSWQYNGSGRELMWDDLNQRADIMAHIIPARTKALGSVISDISEGEIAENINLDFTESNQDHSAVFHGYFGDPVKKKRKEYWGDVLSKVFRLKGYSGLSDNE